jgi:hypothetical protein
MAPFTLAVGFRYPPEAGANVVGAVYGGSELLTPVLFGSGWVIVLVGH